MLAAHAHKLSARNAHLQEILRETRKSIGTPELDLTAEFDHVFWMGDLNYRIDLNMAARHEHMKLGVPNPPPGPYADDHKKAHQAVLKLVKEEVTRPAGRRIR